jgi:hypothetical protein
MTGKIIDFAAGEVIPARRLWCILYIALGWTYRQECRNRDHADPLLEAIATVWRFAGEKVGATALESDLHEAANVLMTSD